MEVSSAAVVATHRQLPVNESDDFIEAHQVYEVEEDGCPECAHGDELEEPGRTPGLAGPPVSRSYTYKRQQ